MILNRYLRFQLIFWVVFSAFFSLKEQTLTVSWQFTQFCVFAFSGFIITHLYRHTLERKQFPYYNFRRVLLVVFVPIMLMGVVVMGYDYLVDILYYNKGFHNQSTYTFTLVGYFIDGCIIFLPWFLLFHLYKYGKKVGELGREKEQQQLALQQMQLQLIMNKLNPHFLFNTFNTIRWLINKDTEKAREAIDVLAEIMRYSTQQNVGAIVSLQDELTIVEKYLFLEKLRFEDDLIYTITCPPNLLQRQIVPFLLLNTVENAVKHGEGKLQGHRQISLQISEEKNQLWIEIKNPGYLKNQTLGFGLTSIETLLTQAFGSNSSITMTEENGIVCTTIRITYA